MVSVESRIAINRVANSMYDKTKSRLTSRNLNRKIDSPIAATQRAPVRTSCKKWLPVESGLYTLRIPKWPLTIFHAIRLDNNMTTYCAGQPAMSEGVGLGHVKRSDRLKRDAIVVVDANAPTRHMKSSVRESAPWTLSTLK